MATKKRMTDMIRLVLITKDGIGVSHDVNDDAWGKIRTLEVVMSRAMAMVRVMVMRVVMAKALL